jgi:hypothetical protein
MHNTEIRKPHTANAKMHTMIEAIFKISNKQKIFQYPKVNLQSQIQIIQHMKNKCAEIQNEKMALDHIS